jgi:hypothetical protein
MHSVHIPLQRTCLYILIVYLPLFGFDPQAYVRYLNENQMISADTLIERSKPVVPCYSSINIGSEGIACAFFDSLQAKYGITDDELTLIKKNGFVITERLKYSCFGKALLDIYAKDLPVFVTTDAILYAMHKSYDDLLMQIESSALAPKIQSVLNSLYSTLPKLAESYKDQPLLQASLYDVDAYVTMALSLTDSVKRKPALAGTNSIDQLWNLVAGQQMTSLSLFSETQREIDFSQFTVRGHYTRSKQLSNYFRAMMWLGRIDFLLSPPPSLIKWPDSDIKRMTIDACLLNELITLAGVRDQLNGIDQFLTLLVGESDNLTPSLLLDIVQKYGLQNSGTLMEDAVYEPFCAAVKGNPASGQKILSDFFIMNPCSSTPDTLPVSFRLLGQRFIVDSYILGNVVYDRVIFKGQKILRMMPDPLDAMYVLGNNDALQLLKPQLDQYPYAPQLSALRYLVDSYKPAFWDLSLYNAWLNAIRLLRTDDERKGLPLFMKTAAWHQEKLNTQLSSWAQLRHDNLLYAKQSYTGGATCSYPHGYVEPYPEFYRQIAVFAEKAALVMGSMASANAQYYFSKLSAATKKLDTLAQKELAGTLFSPEDTAFLHKMLFITGSGCTQMFSGWYADLFYDRERVDDSDYIVADVHTQPTDENGDIVGKVLHCGTGKVNLGIFLAPSPSSDYAPMVFVGPVASYYEKITQDFERLTDEAWVNVIKSNILPPRPDWVNSYCTNSEGSAMPSGRTIKGIDYNAGIKQSDKLLTPKGEIFIMKWKNGCFTIQCTQRGNKPLALRVYNQKGQIVTTLPAIKREKKTVFFFWNPSTVSGGIYLFKTIGGKTPLIQKAVVY